MNSGIPSPRCFLGFSFHEFWFPKKICIGSLSPCANCFDLPATLFQEYPSVTIVDIMSTLNSRARGVCQRHSLLRATLWCRGAERAI